MRFTIVTPSLNCREYLPQNFESVQKQGFGPDELEQWVIDGGSTDGTVEFLKSQTRAKWISEKDKGLSDAVNKGIQRATGDWIIWLNADDLLSDGALKLLLEYAAKYPDIKMFAGDQAILDYQGNVEVVSQGWDYNLKDLMGMRTGMNQASTIVHREVYEKAGLIDISIRYAMDYEWLVRAMHLYKCVYIPAVLTSYRRRKGSIMDANMAKHFETFLAVRRKYNLSPLTLAEARIRFFIYTDFLRQTPWIRKTVRKVKGLFGQAPRHPMS
jgi:glycosyltransferase involved in cell wall biosynthesis